MTESNKVAAIDYTFHADSCGDDETAAEFAAWADAELRRRYPDADVRVRVSYNTSGVALPVRVQTTATDWDEIAEVESDVDAEVAALWSDWERAGWPIEA